MADIKLADIFGGVGGMSDQVITNKNDITQLKTDVNARVKKSGDTMTGSLALNASTKQLTFVNTNNYISASGNKVYIAANNGTDGRVILEGKLNPMVRIGSSDTEIYHWGNKQADLPVNDIRGTATTPSRFGDKSLTAWFNNTGLPTSSWYSGITVKGWADGYNVWELFSHSSTGASDNKLHFRTGMSGTWNTTYEVYHSGRKPQPGELGVYSKSEADSKFALKAGDTITGTYKFTNGGPEPVELYAPANDVASVRLRGKTNSGTASWYIGTNGTSNDLNVYSNIHGHGITVKANQTEFSKNIVSQQCIVAVNKAASPDYNTSAIEVQATGSGGASIGFHLPAHSAHSIQMRRDYLGLQVLAQGQGLGNILAGTVESRGSNSQGFSFHGKIAIGGTNDSWLRMNPSGQFRDGIYCGSVGTLRHDSTIQRGGWGANATNIMRVATDGGWSVAGDAAFSYIQTNTNGAHWLLGSYKDGSTLRSGIQVLSNETGNMRFYTNQRNNFVEISDGNFLAQNNVTAFSDIRVKKNILTIDDALNKTLRLRGVTYDRIDQDNIRQTGLIAQDVEKVLPEAVITSPNGDIEDFKSVAYGNLVGLLVESIRELNNKIERLESLIKE